MRGGKGYTGNLSVPSPQVCCKPKIYIYIVVFKWQILFPFSSPNNLFLIV